MKLTRLSGLFCLLFICAFLNATAQPALQNNFSYSLRIPSVIGMESSEAHLYVLSESEGMAVFRTRADSLQWLYTTAGMQNRGHNLQADIRFAYLYGNTRRLTILEPTSVMGAYSATTLPAQPLDAERIDKTLYVILGTGELGTLDLSTADKLDSPINKVDLKSVTDKNFVDIEASADRLFLLSGDSELFTFDKNGNEIDLDGSTGLGENITRLFYVGNLLLATNNDGDIYEISPNGDLSALGSIGEPIIEIKAWGDWLVIKDSSHKLWSSYQLRKPTLWKADGDAGNYLAASKGQLWVAEYNRISRITQIDQPAGKQTNATTSSVTSTLAVKPIDDLVIPYPHSLIIPLQLEGNFPVDQVQFNLQADVEGPVVRGQSLYWLPQSGDEGRHQFKIIASTKGGQSSSTSFSVDVRSFNAPPRFTPMRTISIPVNEPFSLPIRATDPDGLNKNLIRYLGVNLPQGATIDEETGNFSWSPSERNLGENTFRVIATDQYGAAASANMTIRVIETNGRRD